MEISIKHQNLLEELMVVSAQKGNLANAAIVIDGDKYIDAAESWVISSHDATAHSERMLVERVCKCYRSNVTPGLTMITVVEPCLMCISACLWAGYEKMLYIIPAKKYVSRLPWMTDVSLEIKRKVLDSTEKSLILEQAIDLEEKFSKIFETAMAKVLSSDLE